MRISRLIRLGLITAVFGCLVLAVSAGRRAESKQPAIPHQNSAAIELAVAESTAAQPRLVSNWTFYSVRHDVRRCASPMCGGYWVRRVNQSLTRCANGSWRRECYVAEIDWQQATQVEPNQALLRGNIVSRRFPHFGNLGAFRVTEAWKAATDKLPSGIFYRVRDRGVRCITHPCLSHVESKLNAAVVKNIAGVNLEGAGADGELVSAASAAMTETAGVIVAGNNAVVTGPGGRAQTLKATQFYMRATSGGPPTSSLPGRKPCIKTGCSSEICSDEPRVSPCIYRSEFACYQKAACERQSDGSCGFTRTPELTACLSRR